MKWMKQLLALVLALTMCFSLISCGKSASEEQADQSSAVVSTPDTAEETDETDEPEADASTADGEQALADITITIPANLAMYNMESLFEGYDASGIKSVQHNEDGSVTYVFSGDKYKDIIASAREQTLESIEKAFPSERYPSVKSCQVSDDVTKATMIVDWEAFNNSSDTFSLYIPLASLWVYQICSGVDSADVQLSIDIQDETSGEIMDSYRYPEDFQDLMDNYSYPEEFQSFMENYGDSEEFQSLIENYGDSEEFQNFMESYGDSEEFQNFMENYGDSEEVQSFMNKYGLKDAQE